VNWCTIYKSRIKVVLNVTIPYQTSAIFIIGNFQNPSTTMPIANILTFLTNGTVYLKSRLQNTYLSNLSPNLIKQANLMPSSDVIGANGLTFTVSFTTNNVFLPTDMIWVQFPFWNPLSNSPLHMIQSAMPLC
jgi:hypothetical protein